MDKLQAWLRRIQQPPRREVANLDYWSLLAETRIAPEGFPAAEEAPRNAKPGREGMLSVERKNSDLSS